MRSYGGWLVGTLAAIGVPYAGEKWANQEPPKRSLEWIVVLALVIILPLMLAAFEDKLKKWFLNRFSPAEASKSELKHLRHFIGVDHLRIALRPPEKTEIERAKELFGSDNDEGFFQRLEQHREEIRRQSSLEHLEPQFKDRHFAAAYGTAGLVCEIVKEELGKEELGLPFRFDSIHLIVTEPIKDDEVKRLYTNYTRKLLTKLGVVSSEERVFFNFYDVRLLDTKLGHLQSYYESAVDKALEISSSSSSTKKDGSDFQVCVDLTGGTVLHSLAGAKIADEFSALLIYNVTLQDPNARIRDRLTVVKV